MTKHAWRWMLLGALWAGVLSVRCSLVIDPLAIESAQSNDPCRSSCAKIGFEPSFCKARCLSVDALGPECLDYCDGTLRKKAEQDALYHQTGLRQSLCNVTCGSNSVRRRCWDTCGDGRPPPPPGTTPPDGRLPCDLYFCGPALSNPSRNFPTSP